MINLIIYLAYYIKYIFTGKQKIYFKVGVRIKGRNIFGKNISLSNSYIRDSILKNNISVKDNCRVGSTLIDHYVIINKDCLIYDSAIGRYSYLSSGCLVSNAKIGSFCSIGQKLLCSTANHPSDWVSTSPVFYSVKNQCGFAFADKDYFVEFKNIEIGNDVWIGNDVNILGGVKIGNGAIIATGAVVVSDVPDYAIYGGVPAKLIKYRFNEEIILELLKLKWWDWSVEKLQQFSEYFRNDPQSLINNFKIK